MLLSARIFWASAVLAGAAFGQPTSTSPLAPPANGPRRADPTWVALADCTLHAAPGQEMSHATVVFRDGRITAILAGVDGGAGPARLPLGPRVVDCKGLHVYAAFIDACVEVDAPAPRGEEVQLHWNPKITPQRSALDGGGIDEGSAGALRKMGFGAAAITPRGGIFRGRGALVSLAKAPEDVSAGKPLVYRDGVYASVALEAGGGYPDSLMGAVAVVRQTFSDADWQAAERSAGRNTDAPNALDALVNRAGAPVLLMNTDNELDVMRVAKIAGEFKREYMVLGSGQEYRRLGAVKATGAAFVLPLNFPKAPDVSTLAKQEGVELREMMAWEQSPTNPRRMRDAGISYALTTAKLRDKGEFTRNLRTAIKLGLKEEEALAALTTTPARMLGAEDLGTVATGKRANLIVADGPVFGMTAEKKESRIRSVWIDGVFHEIAAAPVSYEGMWDVSIPADARPITRRLEIGADNGIEVYRDDKHVKASKVDAAAGKLSFVFDHDSLDGNEGLCTMAALVSEGGDGMASDMTGYGMTGTGRRFEWIAKRRPRSLAGVWPLKVGENEMVLVFDKDNTLGVKSLHGSDGAAGQHVTWDGTTLRCDADGGGGAGIKVDAKVDWTKTPAVMTGEAMGAAGNKTSFVSTRRDANPFVGTWRVTEADGAAKDASAKDGLTMKIGGESVTLTFGKATGEPVVIKGEDVKFTLPTAKRDEGRKEEPKKEEAKKEEGEEHATGAAPGGPEAGNVDPAKAEAFTLIFSHDLKKLGGEGKSRDRVTITFGKDGADGDALAGEGTLPDGSKHAYKAVRQEKKDDDAPTDIPEKIVTPMGPYGLEAPVEAAAGLVISNATIWTCGPQGKIEQGFVYVKGGKIEMVGQGDPAGVVPRDDKTEYIDAKGRHVTPGIIDCHSHTGISGSVNEGGQAITSEVRIEDVTNPDAVNWYQQLAGGVTCVNNLHGSANAIGGQSQTNKVRWGCESPDDMHFDGAMPGIKFALGENPRRANGGDGTRYPATRMGVEMLIRDRFTAAKEYAARSGDPSRRKDYELEPLAEVLAGKRLVHCHSYRQDEMLMLAMVAKDFGFKIGTYQHALEGYKVADYVRDYSGGASGFADWWAYKVEVQDAIPAAFPIMAEQGVCVSFNSDSSEMARRLNTEAAKAMKYGGVSDVEALKYVTLNPAKQLHIDGRVGSLEAGKDADIAVWSGSPLSAFSRCEATYVDGRRLFSLETDAAARERIRGERARLIQKLLNDGKKKEKEEPGSDAKPEGRPGGPPPDGAGRRRRRPSEEDEAAALRAFYIDLHNRGVWHEQGVCGCYQTGADAQNR